MIERLRNWFAKFRRFMKGPKFPPGTVVWYARTMRRVSHAGWESSAGVWRYRLQGDTKVNFSEAEIDTMSDDLARYLTKKIF